MSASYTATSMIDDDADAIPSDSLIAAAQRKWDVEDLDLCRRVAWLSLSTVGSSIWRRFCGNEQPVNFVARIVAERRGTEGLCGVAVVCGDMQGERTWFEDLPGVSFNSVDGYDISAASMARYTPKNRLEFRPHQVDCNRLDLPPGSFDFGVAWHGAHHIENLGGLFYQIHQSLRPGGLLLIYEWIGPAYLQIPKANAWVTRMLVWSLFSRRERTTHMGIRKGLRYIQDKPGQFDPSEACNSTDLMPQYLRYFSPLAQTLHGGLLYPVFEGTAQNLDEDAPWTHRRIRTVILAERLLAGVGIVRPLFAISLGVRREGIVGAAASSG